ncbi:MAG TPA: hypothetical protein VKQ32_10000, partial [Polyangia bacterium]|nr:hypothetical protein [Polyangia bacterium]
MDPRTIGCHAAVTPPALSSQPTPASSPSPATTERSADVAAGRAGVVAPSPASILVGVGIEAGLGWLDSVGAVTAAWQPIVRASYGGARGWAGRITVGGLGTQGTLSA